MDSVPSALVRTDWVAIAAWAGVAVNGAVVAAAFLVQRAQARSDRRLAQDGLRRLIDDAAEAVTDASVHLEIVQTWLKSDRLNGVEDQIARLDRETRKVEYYLLRDIPSVQMVSLLIESRNDLIWLSGEVSRVNRLYVEDKHFAPQLEHDVLRMEAASRSIDWMVRRGAAAGVKQTWS